MIHIGTGKKTQYELLRIAFPGIRPIRRADVDGTLGEDTSLDCSRWKRFIEAGGADVGKAGGNRVVCIALSGV